MLSNMDAVHFGNVSIIFVPGETFVKMRGSLIGLY